MVEIGDTERVYYSPSMQIIALNAEGILCISNNIPDWEENEDVL